MYLFGKNYNSKTFVVKKHTVLVKASYDRHLVHSVHNCLI